jgi:hypothetical protein
VSNIIVGAVALLPALAAGAAASETDRSGRTDMGARGGGRMGRTAR